MERTRSIKLLLVKTARNVLGWWVRMQQLYKHINSVCFNKPFILSFIFPLLSYIVDLYRLSSVRSSPVNSPVILPAFMIRARSHNAVISATSSDTTSTAMPCLPVPAAIYGYHTLRQYPHQPSDRSNQNLRMCCQPSCKNHFLLISSGKRLNRKRMILRRNSDFFHPMFRQFFCADSFTLPNTPDSSFRLVTAIFYK